MGFFNCIAFAVVCLVVLGDAMPQERFRAKSIPFGQRPKFENTLSQPKERTSIPKAPVLDTEEKRHVFLDTLRTGQPVVPNPFQETVVVRKPTEDEEALLFRQQAENAKYSFETSVDDGIMGHSHSRSEVRNGLAVEGMYSYSDGFYLRTVHYVADDKGYRVIKDENIPIGDGPLIDLKGEANVKSSLGSDYTVTVNDYQKNAPSQKV